VIPLGKMLMLMILESRFIVRADRLASVEELQQQREEIKKSDAKPKIIRLA
jgi:hypothetical protein